jgi:hypothetical protein
LEAAAQFASDLAKARWDIRAYGRVLGIKVHPGQVRFFNAVMRRDANAIRAAFLNIALSSGNRAGKTLGLTIVLLHHAQFKIGLPTPDATDAGTQKWRDHPWHWYHFGVQQEIADLVWQEASLILSGTHPAQKGGGCPLTAFLGKGIVQTDKKERGEYRWIVFDKMLGGAEIHFRTTNEKAIGQLGKDMHGISYDECGFDPNLTWIVNEVLHMRRLSTAGQLILISTPSESFQQFADEWEKGNPDSPDRVPYHYSVRMSTRENIGYGIGEVEFDRLVAAMPKHLVPQNVDGHFIEGRNAFFDATAVEACFDPGLPVHIPSTAQHLYVQGVDPALSHDATWSIVLDYTARSGVLGVQALRREGKQSLPALVELITDAHYQYNAGAARCMTACDTSGMGGKVFKQALETLHPFRAVEFGGARSKKLKLLTDLKGYIESGKLRFPKQGVWLDLRRQLLAYRLDDRNLKTDAVMALAVAVKQLVSGAAAVADSSPSSEFDMFAESTPASRVERVGRNFERVEYTDATTPGLLGRRIRGGSSYEVS